MPKRWDFGGLDSDDLNTLLDAIRSNGEASNGILMTLAQEENAATRALEGTDEEAAKVTAQIGLIKNQVVKMAEAINTANIEVTALDALLTELQGLYHYEQP